MGDNLRKTVLAILLAFVLLLVNFNIIAIVSSDSSLLDNITYRTTNNRLNRNFLRDIFVWILKLFGLYDPDDGGDEGGGDNGDGEKPTEPEIFTKKYDFYTNPDQDKIIRFYAVLEKTGTAGTGISNLEYCWTWFEYKINGEIYEIEPLMARGDNLPRELRRGVYLDGECDLPPIPPGTHYFRACAKNAANIMDYGKWMEFRVSSST